MAWCRTDPKGFRHVTFSVAETYVIGTASNASHARALGNKVRITDKPDRSRRGLCIVQNEGQLGNAPEPEAHETPTHAARYAFEPPEPASKIEFKRVRRASEGSIPSDGHRRIRPTRSKLRTAGGLVVVVVVLLVGAAWTGVQGWQAKGHLQVAAGLFVQLRQQISRADVIGARGTLATLQVETKAARESTDGIGWSMTSRLPFVGDDLRAVRTVSAVLDDLATDGLPALLDVASALDPATLSPRNGRIDLTAMTTAAPRIAAGLAVIRRARQSVAGIRTEGLVVRLGVAVTQLSDGLGEADRLVGTADRAARLLPGMLGAKGPRTYLLLFQNNAEVRATGGMPGAYLVIKADRGAIKMIDQGTAAGDLKEFDKPVRPLSNDLIGLYTDRPALFPADVNLTPDFPTAAALVRAMYQERTGVAVDGVMATDPVALSYLLRVTGSVKLPEGEPLTSENAVRVLLSEAYAKYPNPVDQDAYFAGAARASFEALVNSQGNSAGLVEEVARSAGERRLLVWSADQREEAGIAGTVLEGRLPDNDGMRPTVGVFLNDGGGAKLSYYLHQSAALTVGDCEINGSRELHLKFTIGSSAPGSGLPAYVTGLALSGDPHTSRTNVMVFSPIGGGVVSVALDGKALQFGTGLERERGVGVFTVDLPPGVTRTYDIAIQTGVLPQEGAAISPRLWTTPSVQPWTTSVAAGPRCA
jgi:hypothetical protein